MNVSRRGFLGGGAALFGSVAAAGAAKSARHDGPPRLKIGVIADPHVGTKWMMGINAPATEKAFRDFREQRVDAVAVLGDFSNGGTIAEWEEFAQIWYDVFPDDCGADGTKVEKLFITGNHDVACWKPPEAQDPATHVAPNIAEHWKRLFHEEYAPAWRKEIKGFQFTGLNWGLYPKTEINDAYRREILEPYLKEAQTRAKPGDPIFHLQHAPISNTCYCSGKKGFGTAEQLFGDDAREFVISGHVHKPLTHPRNIWQGEYTALSAGVITWTSFPPFGWPKELPGGAAYAKSQCTISVYDDEIEIERKSVWTGDLLGETWRIPLPLDKATFPYTREKIEARGAAPVFPSGAKVVANVGMGENVFWKVPPNKKAVQGAGGIVLTFPAAEPRGTDDLVMCYEAVARRADDGTELAKRKFYTEFFMGRRYMRSLCEYLFEADALASETKCVFDVCAIDFFGNRSDAITSGPVSCRRGS